jgi:hypothetical protein
MFVRYLRCCYCIPVLTGKIKDYALISLLHWDSIMVLSIIVDIIEIFLWSAISWNFLAKFKFSLLTILALLQNQMSLFPQILLKILESVALIFYADVGSPNILAKFFFNLVQNSSFLTFQSYPFNIPILHSFIILKISQIPETIRIQFLFNSFLFIAHFLKKIY